MATVLAEVTLDETLQDFEDDKEFVNVVGECSIFLLAYTHGNPCFGY